MYKSYNLKISDFNFNDYVLFGRQFLSEDKKAVEESIKKFKNADGSLNASKIIADWFPEIEADVFLSHSHQDSNLVLGLAGWLKKRFGLRSFIDSAVWGYADYLLKLIDDQYCYQASTQTYNYEMRNRSTSHVYMMLSAALGKMINNCECVIFVNTPNSLSIQEHISDSGKTTSPWIYSEISMTSLVQKRTPIEHRRHILKSEALEDYRERMTIEYDINLSHLTDLSYADLLKWSDKSYVQGAEALDTLYSLIGY